MPQNMSYCQFSNTLIAMRECDETLSQTSDPQQHLSDEEYKAFVKMVKLCRRIAGDYEDIK
jgi:hypothetical protein